MHNIDSDRLPPLSFRFRNLGPVKEADLELGDLTVVAGRNNTGKTYVVYTLYGLLKMWRHWIDDEFILRKEPFSKAQFPDLRRVAEIMLRDGNASFSLHDEALQQQRCVIMRKLAKRFSERALAGVLNSPPGVFENSYVETTIKQQNTKETLSKDYAVHDTSGGFDFSIVYDGNEIILKMDPSNNKLQIDDLQFHITHLYCIFLLDDLLPEPFILSSERFGISLFYRELDFTKNQLVDLLQKIGNEEKDGGISPYVFIDRATSRYALPVKDNIDYTRGIPNKIGRKSDIYGSKLFDSMKIMMDGHYSTSEDSIRFKSRNRKKQCFDIPLHLASSSARGLSDLYFFSRHVARKNHILMIDEPESHLDTANQILMARLLARFVHAGLKVLVTTHSDYLIKEINNLIMLSKSFSDKESVIRKLRYTKQDFLYPHVVRAYVAEKGSLLKCSVDQFGIDMPVFDKTIDEINHIANNLASRLKEGDEM